MSNIDLSAGTLEEQLKEAFLEGLSFASDTKDRVKVFTQENEHAEWVRFPYPGTHLVEFKPQDALLVLVEQWNQGYGLRVEVTQHLSGDWDQE